jgi:tricorn protease
MPIVRAVVALLMLAFTISAEDFTRLLRQPDIAGNKITFVYAGDVWVADATGGVARRLTTHEGMEIFPKLSPDGRWVAFSGEYNGTRQVFVISADGGQPRQLTFYNDVGAMPPRGGFDHQVMGWTPDGKDILFHANTLPWGERMSKPYLISPEGGMERPLGIPYGGIGSFSPDGQKYAWTPLDREFRTWKRYRGGRAQDVWIYDLVANKSEAITDWLGTDNQPVWLGEKIYYTSDREAGKLNLYEYDTTTKATRKVTHHDDFDVLWPSGKGGQLVYEAGGYIYRFDAATGSSTRVPISVFGDFETTVPYFKNVTGNIESFDISPSGARVVMGARGEVFTVPGKDGEIRNLTHSSGIREIGASWSPDGKWIAYLGDRSGEYEIYVRPSDGSGKERRVTNDGKTWRFDPVWSPDSKWLAYSDKDLQLRVVDVATGKTTDVDRSGYNDIRRFSWSPDSKWLAYAKQGANRFNSIWVWSLDRKTSRQLTSEMTNDDAPVFDPEGRYLYFLSNRDYNLKFSDYEFTYLYGDSTRVYAGVLSRSGPALFLPKSDEEKVDAGKEKDKPTGKDDKGKKNGDEPKKAVDVKIDVEGFENRVVAIPGSPGDYGALRATKAGPMYIRTEGENRKLALFKLEDEKEEVVLEGVNAYVIAAKGEKLVYRKGSEYGIAEAKGGQSGTRLELGRLEMKIVPKDEWAQIFDDGWRIVRDWFYDPAMHGVDWNLMRERYGALVPYVSHRADLDYIFGEMGGELNSGHVYVQWGEFEKPKRRDGGLLGAEIERDASGYFRVAKIFPGENWHEAFRSPLTAPGVNVAVGDYILAVDGVPAKDVDNFYRLLENKGGQVVTLLVNGRADTAGARSERVRTVKSETNLRYLDWVQSRREYVDKASGGRIGYIHIPDTATAGNRELFKYFYPQAGKDALIIDDRYNGGGFIPERMIELLDRPILSYWARRGTAPNQTPGFAHEGPKVTLINGYAASGGDAFPYYFRKRGLGRLIGSRTWGGLIGISFNPNFADGGSILVPTFRFYDTDGMWQVENYGVAPDIEVFDRPEALAAGQDPTLEKAVEVLLEELKTKKVEKPAVPEPPDESK